MTPEQIAAFNKACAEFMGYEPIPSLFHQGLYKCSNGPDEFNPYHDANDRNRVIEKMRIDTDFYDEMCKCFCHNGKEENEILEFAQSESMEQAQIACIAKALEVDYVF